MRLKRIATPILLLFIIAVTGINEAKAQSSGSYWEAGGFVGASSYLGDLQEKPVHTNELHPYLSGFIRYSTNENLSFRAGLSYGSISGSDENATSADRRYRNLSFHSDIYEVSAIAEWNIFGLNFRTMRNSNITPYVFAGIAVFRFNPQTEFQGETIALQPLNTEGQGLPEYPERQPYSLTQFSIPHGVGVKVQLSSRVAMSLEVGPRKTFTDYLDDVSTDHVDKDVLRSRRGEMAALLSDRSWELEIFEEQRHGEGHQRGNPDDDDWYVFVGAGISFNLASESCPLQ